MWVPRWQNREIRINPYILPTFFLKRNREFTVLNIIIIPKSWRTWILWPMINAITEQSLFLIKLATA